jgi:hypothetical protein
MDGFDLVCMADCLIEFPEAAEVFQDLQLSNRIAVEIFIGA